MSGERLGWCASGLLRLCACEDADGGGDLAGGDGGGDGGVERVEAGRHGDARAAVGGVDSAGGEAFAFAADEEGDLLHAGGESVIGFGR